jgi:hypothetical protein
MPKADNKLKNMLSPPTIFRVACWLYQIQGKQQENFLMIAKSHLKRHRSIVNIRMNMLQSSCKEAGGGIGYGRKNGI